MAIIAGSLENGIDGLGNRVLGTDAVGLVIRQIAGRSNELCQEENDQQAD